MTQIVTTTMSVDSSIALVLSQAAALAAVALQAEALASVLFPCVSLPPLSLRVRAVLLGEFFF